MDFGNVAHGSRIRRREVSLVFNAVDSAEGLTEVLNTLSARGLRATFFVNGEFIRRYPDAVREIADSGHEVGLPFYAYFNLTDARFTVDGDSSRRGSPATRTTTTPRRAGSCRSCGTPRTTS